MVSYDIIGSREKAVAIVEIPKELDKKEEQIAEEILKKHKNVKSVLKKTSERKGELRLRNYKLILGEKNTEVIHKEYGYKLKLDPRKVYFSPREGTERQRIANIIKPKESILVPFSGVAPFIIAILKKQPYIKEIYGIELNKIAHKYAQENIKLNKIENKVNLINGDVKLICPKIKKKFDRIIMPWPVGGYKFLDFLIPLLKKGGVLHFYYWSHEKDLFSEAKNIIKKSVEKFKRKFKILSKKKVLPYGPRKWKVVLDVLIY